MIMQWLLAVTPECISEICSLETAKQTIRVTTQHGIRSAMHPLRRHYRTDLISLRYHCLNVLMYLIQCTLRSSHSTRTNVPKSLQLMIMPLPTQCMQRDTLVTCYECLRRTLVSCELLMDNANMMMGHEADFNKQAHFLKTWLEDHNLGNNNDILGQKTQNT